MNYRNYKNFDNEKFNIDLVNKLNELNNHDLYGINCDEFENIFISTFNRHAPKRKRYIRVNNLPSMNKPLSKAIMIRTRLRNKFFKSKTSESREAYKKQRNYCVSLLRETKRCSYENLNPKFISDNKKCWMQVKPFFSDKTPPNSKIILVEGEEIISDSSKCARAHE